MTPRGFLGSFLALLTFFAASCGRRAPNIVIGSENNTEQAIVGEIVAQHLEKSLGVHVTRSPGLGGALLAFQSLQSGVINIYAEYTGSIVAEILKEQPAPSAEQVLQRARGEIARIAQADLIGPLGTDSSYMGVIRADDPRAAKVSDMSEAAQVDGDGWKVGYSLQFQQQSDGMPALTAYHLPMEAPMHPLDASGLFKSLGEGTSTMIIARATDGQLRSRDWKTLPDDRKLFSSEQLCLVVQRSLLAAEPGIAQALGQFTGKFTNEKMRELNAQVDVDRRKIPDVARDFLASMQ
jgi:glycine betaine/choline ABC-type transport system substrate-binding protein